MLNALTIRRRLAILIGVTLATLMFVIAFSIWNLNKEAELTKELVRSTEQNSRLAWMADTVLHRLFRVAHDVDAKQMSWAEAQEEFKELQEQINIDWSVLFAGLDEKELAYFNNVLGSEYPGLERAINTLDELFVKQDEVSLRSYIVNDMYGDVDPFLNAVLASNAEQRLVQAEVAAKSAQSEKSARKNIATIAAIGLVLIMLLSSVIARSITRPVNVLSETISGIAAGNNDIRSNLKGPDELSQLGQALDGLMDDRVATLVSALKDNDDLNDSVMELLEGVSDLSDRDLTVNIPVRSDITGTVADAINNMTEQTASVLSLVNTVAHEVDVASEAVDQRANTVSKVANAQREVIEGTMKMLEDVSVNMEAVSNIAAQCNTEAGKASDMTDTAMDTVQNTVTGMNEIREMIQETGKRMKRLGERSNEISEVVDIINAIAERTHVLALNASMQAASAGEAGKGFAVVAEEVQKLAESARESTAEISGLVRNIQVDTSDTIATMDRTIANVVEGTMLAEAAGQKMTETQEVTNNLVASIDRIATTSAKQVEASKGIQEHAAVVVERTRLTVEHLVGQLKQTKLLRGHAEKLNQAVGMFKLPSSRAERKDTEVQEAA